MRRCSWEGGRIGVVGEIRRIEQPGLKIERLEKPQVSFGYYAFAQSLPNPLF